MATAKKPTTTRKTAPKKTVKKAVMPVMASPTPALQPKTTTPARPSSHVDLSRYSPPTPAPTAIPAKSPSIEFQIRTSRPLIVGGIAAVLALVAFILGLTMDWYSVEFAGESASFDRDAIDAESWYNHTIFTLPFIALGFVFLGGLVLAASQVIVHATARRWLGRFAWTAMSIAGYTAFIGACRFLGAWTVNEMSTGTANLTPVYPWVLLGASLVTLGLIAWCGLPTVNAWWGQPANRLQKLAALGVAMVAVGFAASPFLPNFVTQSEAVDTFGGGTIPAGTRYTNEGILGGEGSSDLKTDLAWAYWMVWTAVGLALLTIMTETLRVRLGTQGRFLHPFALAIVPLIIATIFTVFYYIDGSDLGPQATFSFNHVPAVMVVGLTALWGVYTLNAIRTMTSSTTQTPSTAPVPA